MQKRALKKVYECDEYFHTAKTERLENRRDRMCIELIKNVTNVDHKLHASLPHLIEEVRSRETRQNSQMYYNFMMSTEQFRNSPIIYAILKHKKFSTNGAVGFFCKYCF